MGTIRAWGELELSRDCFVPSQRTASFLAMARKQGAVECVERHFEKQKLYYTKPVRTKPTLCVLATLRLRVQPSSPENTTKTTTPSSFFYP